LSLSVALSGLLLAAIWGSSFLFMRIGAPEFGPIALMSIRVGLAALCLAPLLMFTRGFSGLRAHWRAVLWVGAVNSAIPFVLLTYSTLSLPAGYTSILNAIAPFWTTLIAAIWFGERFNRSQLAGLAVGLAGVTLLVVERIDWQAPVSALPIVAAIVATGFYGYAANYARQRLAGVDSLTTATGAMLGASIVLVPAGVAFWPLATPSGLAWFSAISLAIACSAVAYILYFRLIAHLGALRATTVTFLIPAFGMFFGWLFLDERVTPLMLIGCGLIILGTALTLKLFGSSAGKPA
jgi:drug/metabolite transporter (DMT)-like permease